MPLDRCVFLIGYRGTGKTTVARLLAERFGCQAVDADHLLQQRDGRTVAEIFAQEGEPRFRDLEQQVVADLAVVDPQVVSLGGGAVLREPNRLALKGHHVAWLQASPTTIAERLASDEVSADQRPSLTGGGLFAEIEQVLAARQPIYQECATMVVDTENRSPAEVADDILRQLDLPRL
ncbi:shikimate kinase [Aeoliella mucimassa]|uniref:Shikimate kinase n=1 Tax=Aeoliella mucimassa TaxID=2527972 RepID=A0A518ALC5_9BACT|nr:shikimate kinase [Aeoliella mucimassa]QDU55533.1 Shikimate kinase [Aeoliella mucimassa]